MKACFKCGVVQPLSDFYSHSEMADGHLNKCKDCTKRDMQIARQTNPSVRQYDRARASQPHRKALRKRVVKAWNASHPGRNAAHQKARRAHREAPASCSRCGLVARLERHHPDYSQPLLIEWLCKPCHAIADRERRLKESA